MEAARWRPWQLGMERSFCSSCCRCYPWDVELVAPWAWAGAKATSSSWAPSYVRRAWRSPRWSSRLASSICCISLGTLVWRPTNCVLVQHHLWKSIYSTSRHQDKTPPSFHGCSCSMPKPARALCLPTCSNQSALKYGRGSPGMCVTRNQRRNKNTWDRSALYFSTAKFHSGLCFGLFFFFFPEEKESLLKRNF